MRGVRKFVVLVLVGALVGLASLAQQPLTPIIVDPEAVLAAKIQEMLAKGPEYFAIAERANRALSPLEKTSLASGIRPLLARGEAMLGGPKAPPTLTARIPPEIDTLMGMIGEEIIGVALKILGKPRSEALGILRPVTEVRLEAPQTCWICYYSYVYAYWTYYYAYWTYVCHDTVLAYYTLSMRTTATSTPTSVTSAAAASPTYRAQRLYW